MVRAFFMPKDESFRQKIAAELPPSFIAQWV